MSSINGPLGKLAKGLSLITENTTNSNYSYPSIAIIATELFACRLTLSLREVKGRKTVTRLGSPSEKTRRKLVKVVMLGDEFGTDTMGLATISHTSAPFSSATPAVHTMA